MREAVCCWVKTIFTGGPLEPDLNNILIVLIPKVFSPESFVEFRTISLCSVLYKLMMKIIANRFKHIFPKVIAHEQAGFIIDRNITNNIIIA